MNRAVHKRRCMATGWLLGEIPKMKPREKDACAHARTHRADATTRGLRKKMEAAVRIRSIEAAHAYMYVHVWVDMGGK